MEGETAVRAFLVSRAAAVDDLRETTPDASIIADLVAEWDGLHKNWSKKLLWPPGSSLKVCE